MFIFFKDSLCFLFTDRHLLLGRIGITIAPAALDPSFYLALRARPYRSLYCAGGVLSIGLSAAKLWLLACPRLLAEVTELDAYRQSSENVILSLGYRK